MRIRKKTKVRRHIRKTKNGPVIVSQHTRRIDKVTKNLYHVALNDPDPSIRKKAVDTIGDMENEADLELLEYALLNDPEEEVRLEAVKEIGDIHSPSSLEALSKAIRDESPKIRKAAIETIEEIQKNNSKRAIARYA